MSSDQLAELAALNGDCGQHDPEMWTTHERNRSTRIDAKRICAKCPVLAECQGLTLDYELETNQNLYGIWGGLDEAERQQIKEKRNA